MKQIIDEIKSHKIKKLKEKILSGDENQINIFWNMIEEKGSPLIERIEDDNHNYYVTLIWRGNSDTNCVSVFGEMFGLDTDETKLERLLSTDLWYRTWKVSGKSHSVYMFVINETDGQEWEELDFRIDPLNPNKYICPDDEKYPNEYHLSFKEESYIALPNYIENEWTIEKEGTLQGELVEITEFKSKVLGNQRRIWFYTPHDYQKNGDEYGLAVFTDGWEYLNIVEAKTVLDNLIYGNKIPSVCALFIETHDNREKELTCSEEFNDFLANELLTWVFDKYNVSREAKKNLIGGFSLGGLNAAYIALKQHNLFGKLFCHSSAFYWNDDEKCETGLIVKEFEKCVKLPLKIYLTIGEFEKDFDYHYNANISFKNILEDKGYEYLYEEFTGGHTYMDAKINFSNGLIYLLGKK